VIQITLPDGSVREFPAGVSGHEIALSISEGLARNVLAAKVNDPKELNYKKLLDVFGLYVGFGERNGNNP
jgi:hypothetical protein